MRLSNRFVFPGPETPITYNIDGQEFLANLDHGILCFLL